MKLFKKNESGRSMVEMLGVLAIIGVLSVGGISGYRYATKMMKYNEINEFVNQLSVLLLKEIKNPTVNDFSCISGNNYSYQNINYLCAFLDKKYCQGARTSYNGYYWMDYGKGKDDYFGWEIINAEAGGDAELDLWFSSTEMCERVLSGLKQNSEFTKDSVLSASEIGRGYFYAKWVELSDENIKLACQSIATEYLGRYSIPVGLAFYLEDYECIDE